MPLKAWTPPLSEPRTLPVAVSTTAPAFAAVAAKGWGPNRAAQAAPPPPRIRRRSIRLVIPFPLRARRREGARAFIFADNSMVGDRLDAEFPKWQQSRTIPAFVPKSTGAF